MDDFITKVRKEEAAIKVREETKVARWKYKTRWLPVIAIIIAAASLIVSIIAICRT